MTRVDIPRPLLPGEDDLLGANIPLDQLRMDLAQTLNADKPDGLTAN